MDRGYILKVLGIKRLYWLENYVQICIFEYFHLGNFQKGTKSEYMKK